LLYFSSKRFIAKTGARLFFIYRLPKKWICLQTKFHWNKRKLLPKFVFIIYGLPMMIMPLKEFDKMESSSKTANDRKVLWEALLDEESM
jgi:hypothetical protein